MNSDGDGNAERGGLGDSSESKDDGSGGVTIGDPGKRKNRSKTVEGVSGM